MRHLPIDSLPTTVNVYVTDEDYATYVRYTDGMISVHGHDSQDYADEMTGALVDRADVAHAETILVV